MTTELSVGSKKSGKGLIDGVLSELTTFLTVKPGHVEQLRAAIHRFGQAAHELGGSARKSAGLRDLRFVIYDNDRRLLWALAFETDWDPYIDDALEILGVDIFLDWMQHTAEYPDDAAGWGNAEIKAFLQSVQVRAEYYMDVLARKTLPEIQKAGRVEQAFQRVLDDPAAAPLLQHPAMKPLLDQAAD